MPELDLLATFLEIHRTGSLTAAAARRGLSQPAVSGQLARLERQLGVELFTRTNQGVRPTPRADTLAAQVASHVDKLRSAFDPEDDQCLVGQGQLRLGGPAELTTLRVLPALTPLTACGLRLRVQFGLAEDLLTALLEERLDLVVSAIRPTQRGVAATPFLDEEFLLLGAPAFARTVRAELLATDPVRALAHLPLVAYAEDLPIIRRYWRTAFGRRPPNALAVVVPDLRAVLTAVIAGMGVSVLPRYVAESALSAGSVELLHEPAVPPLNTGFLATRVGGLADPVVARAHAHLLERAKAWPTL